MITDEAETLEVQKNPATALGTAALVSSHDSLQSQGEPFSDLSMYQDTLEALRSCRLLGPIPSFWFSSSGMEPRSLHIYQISRWCYWLGDSTENYWPNQWDLELDLWWRTSITVGQSVGEPPKKYPTERSLLSCLDYKHLSILQEYF